WLGFAIAEVAHLDSVLVVGSQLRKDHPLLAQRLRQAARKGTKVSVLHVLDDEQLIKLQHRLIVSPAQMPDALAQVLKAGCELKKEAPPADLSRTLSRVEVSPHARGIAESLVAGHSPAVLLGNLAQHHPQGSVLHRLGVALAQASGAKFGFLGEAANSVGGYVAGAVPFSAPSGLNAAQMLAHPLHA